jgi:hypothetical protein
MNTTQVVHPMVKFQQQVRSLVDAKLVKKELAEFGFSTQDAIGEMLAIDGWDED